MLLGDSLRGLRCCQHTELHPIVKIAKDPDGPTNHDEQDKPSEKNQLEILPLLAFEGKVQEEAEVHDQLKDRAEDQGKKGDLSAHCRHEGEGDDRKNRRQDKTDQIMTKLFVFFH